MVVFSIEDQGFTNHSFHKITLILLEGFVLNQFFAQINSTSALCTKDPFLCGIYPSVEAPNVPVAI